ncbi:MAG: hypothetical protein WD071_16090 [Pseudohongiella sp.]|uniref:hypothetical protein n=1 Tax=Pseudohongiella sp. TaxID=1979412 RepID=UPI0034A004AE
MSTLPFLITLALCVAALFFLRQWHRHRRHAGVALRPALFSGILLTGGLWVAGIDMGWQRAPFMWLGILSMVALFYVILVNLRQTSEPGA